MTIKIIFIGFTAMCSLVFLYIVLPWAVRNILRSRFSGKIRKSGCICLTFDDGPHPHATLEILEMLKAADIKATFFVEGKKVEQYPTVASKIVKMGHEIGSHSYLHTHPWFSLPLKSWRDLLRGDKALSNYMPTGRAILFRPPYGKCNFMTLLYVLLHRRQPVFWDIDPRDYEQTSPETISRHILNELRSGCVILLHDGRNSHSDTADVTVAALRLVLAHTAQQKLCFTTISEALQQG